MYEDENEDQLKIQLNIDETLIHVHLFGPNSLSFTHR